MSITSNLPFSPLASPSPDHTSFSEVGDTAMSVELRSPARPSPSYAPFRSSPLANSSTRATIRRISETGEMEMEDTEEMDTDDVYVMEDSIVTLDEPMDTEEDIQDFQSGPLSSINVEGLFRAGTPTPVVTPPFPQITVPATHPGPDVTTSNGPFTTASRTEGMDMGMGMDAFQIVVPDNIFDGMDDDYNALEDILEMSHEISTEELDTECTSTMSLLI